MTVLTGKSTPSRTVQLSQRPRGGEGSAQLAALPVAVYVAGPRCEVWSKIMLHKNIDVRKESPTYSCT